MPSRKRGSSRGKTIAAAAAAVFVASAGVAVGIPGVGAKFEPLRKMFAGSAIDMIIPYKVQPANLPVTVNERGNLESSENDDVYCKVEGQTTIIKILSEGTPVKKGDLVCELDSAALRDNLTNQEIATRGADAAYQNAKLTREVAEIAVIEYEQGIYKQERETVLGEIALADANCKRAEDRLDWTVQMNKKGYVSEGQLISERLSLQQAKYNLEQAQTKKFVLEKYTHDKTVKELKSEVEKARSDELAKEQTWQLETTKERKLRTQIENCKLLAPSDGIVVYANDPSKGFGSNQPQIEEGATVRERQKVFTLPDISKMQVNVKVHESMVNSITPGLRARIKVDAFAEQTLVGEVKDVAPLPDQTNFFASDVKVYTTHVSIDKSLPGLRPGMTAQVEILVAELEKVLSVPAQALLEYKDKDHLAVKGAQGYAFRDVTVGTTNDKLVEIKKGLVSGDVVALNPVALMSEEEKREAFGSASKDASKKDWGEAKAKVAPGAVAKGDALKGDPGADPAKKDALAAGKEKGKTKGQRKGGGMNPALFEKMKNIPPDERAKMKGASQEEREEIMRKAGFTDAELQQMQQMRAAGGFGGGPPGGGGFGGGPPGGGPGGPQQ